MVSQILIGTSDDELAEKTLGRGDRSTDPVTARKGGDLSGA